MTQRQPRDDASNLARAERVDGELTRPLDVLEGIPEPGVWLADQLSPRTREAYENDVRDFVGTLSLDTSNLEAELARVTRRSAIAWRHALKERGLKPSTVRRKLSALTSLYSHLVNHGVCQDNPFRELKRPKRTSRLGTTPAFTKQEAKAILDAPGSDSLRALRDHALLRIGFQAGLRRAEIASLTVGAFCIDHGQHCLRFYRKGGEEQVLPLHAITVAALNQWLDAAGIRDMPSSPLFLIITGQSVQLQVATREGLSVYRVGLILKKYVKRVFPGREKNYAAHAMRATFITRALDAGVEPQEVQRAAGHANLETTMMYDRRSFDLKRAATLKADYD